MSAHHVAAKIPGKTDLSIMKFPPSFPGLQVFSWSNLCSDLTEKHIAFISGFLLHTDTLLLGYYSWYKIRKKLVMEGGFSELSSNNWGRAGSGKGRLGPGCLGFLGVAQGLMDM